MKRDKQPSRAPGKARRRPPRGPVPWPVKLNLKLTKLLFPRSTQILRKNPKRNAQKLLTPGYLRAREVQIQIKLVGTTAARRNLHGQEVAEEVMKAVYSRDMDFLRDFVKGLSAPVNNYGLPSIHLYRFMIDHAPEISALTTAQAIFNFVIKNPRFGEFDFNNFARLCREIGLPVKK